MTYKQFFKILKDKNDNIILHLVNKNSNVVRISVLSSVVKKLNCAPVLNRVALNLKLNCL